MNDVIDLERIDIHTKSYIFNAIRFLITCQLKSLDGQIHAALEYIKKGRKKTCEIRKEQGKEKVI